MRGCGGTDSLSEDLKCTSEETRLGRASQRSPSTVPFVLFEHRRPCGPGRASARMPRARRVLSAGGCRALGAYGDLEALDPRKGG